MHGLTISSRSRRAARLAAAVTGSMGMIIFVGSVGYAGEVVGTSDRETLEFKSAAAVNASLAAVTKELATSVSSVSVRQAIHAEVGKRFDGDTNAL